MTNVKTKKTPRKNCPVGCIKKPSLKKSPKKTYKKKSPKNKKKSPKNKKKSSPKNKKKSSPKKIYNRHRTATKVCDMYGNCSETVIDEYESRSPSRMEETITNTKVCNKYGNCTETVVDDRKHRSNPRKTTKTEYWIDTITDAESYLL